MKKWIDRLKLWLIYKYSLRTWWQVNNNKVTGQNFEYCSTEVYTNPACCLGNWTEYPGLFYPKTKTGHSLSLAIKVSIRSTMLSKTRHVVILFE